MDKEEFLCQEKYRENSYKLLSECYYVPEAGLLAVLNSLDNSIGRLSSEIAKSVPPMTDLESLKIDYARLFVGPYRLLAPPYGSVYMEKNRMLMGDSTIDVKHRYAEEGLEISLKETPDHISIELEFMYFLIFKEIETLSNDDINRGIDYLQKQKIFLEIHLGAWVSEFSRNIGDNAETDFYQRLARETQRFVLDDLSLLSEESFFDSHKFLGTVSR